MGRLQAELRKKAEAIETPTPPAQPKPAKSETTSPESPSGDAETPTPETQEGGSTPPEPPSPSKSGETKKTNPWKVVDEWKGRATTLEKELAEVRKSIVPEQERKTLETRAQSAEARVKELEDEIRYVNFEKHPDFIKQYDEPYTRAWQLATQELSEISVTDPQTNQPRAATPQDLMELVQLPLGQARAIADQVFGPFADDIMAHRKEIKTLFERKATALKEAKEQGSLRETRQREQAQKQYKEITDHITSTWKKVNDDAINDPKVGAIFKPREGDAEWNQRLTKGFELVDRAYSENPADPKLTPEQRASIIKRHAAVRHRAASWGALMFDNQRKESRIAELEKELAEIKGSVPPPTGESPSTTLSDSGSAMDRMKAKLRSVAK